jgi:hypothetical protein
MTLIKEKLEKELNDMPEEMLGELYEYMKYLKYRDLQTQDGINTAYASEQVLKKDWEKSEEDEAWSNL